MNLYIKKSKTIPGKYGKFLRELNLLQFLLVYILQVARASASFLVVLELAFSCVFFSVLKIIYQCVHIQL